jgi:DUF438 domain-containing protein
MVVSHIRGVAMDEKILELILDSFPFPIVFVDTTHTIRFLNKRAEYHYYKERGYGDLMGKSIFDCHKEKSKEEILTLFEKLRNHGQEVSLRVNVRNERIFVVPVRDEDGKLIGYFERFEQNLQK